MSNFAIGRFIVQDENRFENLQIYKITIYKYYSLVVTI